MRALVLAAVSLLLLAAGPVLADSPPPNRAGLIVQFGDGRSQMVCVDLGPEGTMTGEALLKASGLSPVMEYSSLGGTVCQLDNTGCSYPAEPCWCQCQGDPCVYWAYYHLEDGQWVYSNVGASGHLVRAGDVEGWAWGPGSLNGGSMPPLVTFEALCGDVSSAALASYATDEIAAGDMPVGSGIRLPDRVTGDEDQPPKAAESQKTGPADALVIAGLIVLLVAGSAGLGLSGRRLSSQGVGLWSKTMQRLAQQATRLLHPSIAMENVASWAIYGLTAGIGLVALFYPFLMQVRQASGEAAARVGDGPLLLMALVGLCAMGLLYEIQRQVLSTKVIALLGVLIAINAVLRFVEVGIPGPGGFSPIFVLIILTGYVYGGRFGFLVGAMTMLASAVITGGVGPWLPGQMFAAGWIGLTAPLMRPVVGQLGGYAGSRREVAVLVAFGGLWGLAYGAIMNLWLWPFVAGPADQYYQAGLSLADTVQRYSAYYLTTSLLWDLTRSLGNVVLIAAFGAATLRALRRFRQRFDFEYDTIPAPVPSLGPYPEPEVGPSTLLPNRGG